MNYIKIFALTSMIILLSACGSDSDAPVSLDPDAPVLAAVGDKFAVQHVLYTNLNTSFNFTISATDRNAGDSLEFTMSSVGAPPGGRTNPPAFVPGDVANSALFLWSPTTTEIGEYTIKFTVTDSSNKVLSDSETITIAVIDPQQLYENSCGDCHGRPGNGGTATTKLPATNGSTNVTIMRSAITNIPSMGIDINDFPDAKLQLIEDYFIFILTI